MEQTLSSDSLSSTRESLAGNSGSIATAAVVEHLQLYLDPYPSENVRMSVNINIQKRKSINNLHNLKRVARMNHLSDHNSTIFTLYQRAV